MKCFVIMPYASEFDDVYHAIKRAAATVKQIDCFRLDEERPGGRILARLLDAIQECDMCIADLSGRNPNVMWELGYAMANHKHPILITSDLQDLPFDVFDVHKIPYDRKKLVETLERPLTRSIEHSVEQLGRDAQRPSEVEKLRSDVRRLYRLVASGDAAPATWDQLALPSEKSEHRGPGLTSITGTWIERVTGSRVHARVVRDALVAPYCFEGNHELSGLYYDWRTREDLIFARYVRRHEPVRGVSILKAESPRQLVGNWWDDPRSNSIRGEIEVTQSSRRAEWEYAEQSDQRIPRWAEECFLEIERLGVDGVLKNWHPNGS